MREQPADPQTVARHGTVERLAKGAFGKATYWLIRLKIAPSLAASDETMDYRLSKCRDCEHATRNADGKIDSRSECGICTCPLVQKTAIAREKCPDDPSRWFPEDSSDMRSMRG